MYWVIAMLLWELLFTYVSVSISALLINACLYHPMPFVA